MNMRLCSKRRGTAVLAVSCAAALGLAFGSAVAASADTTPGNDAAPSVVLSPDSTDPVAAETWSLTIPTESSTDPTIGQSKATVGGCQGSFTTVTAVPAEHEFQWGSQLRCTESVAARTGIAIQYCTRDGGPDDFDCNDVAANGGEYTAGVYHVAHTYAKCRGAAHFRPIAFNIKVKNRTYPTVTGNVNTITCK